MYSSWVLSQRVRRVEPEIVPTRFCNDAGRGTRFEVFLRVHTSRTFARINRQQHEGLSKARWINYCIVTSFECDCHEIPRRSYVSITVAYRCYRTFLGRNVSAKRSDRTRENPRHRYYKGFEKKADDMSARPPLCYKVESRWTLLTRQKMNGTSETCCTE